MKLSDFIAALQEIQSQHPDEEVYVALQDQANNFGYDSNGPLQEWEINVEKLLTDNSSRFYYPEGRDMGNRKTVVVLG